jgi:hypothetical protein
MYVFVCPLSVVFAYYLINIQVYGTFDSRDVLGKPVYFLSVTQLYMSVSSG